MRGTEASGKVLVLGLGNVLLGDEGLGVYLVDHMRRAYDFPDGLALMDGGTLGWELLDLVARHRAVVIADAVEADAPPGTLYRFEAHDLRRVARRATSSAHDVEILEVLGGLALLGELPETVVVAMQPGEIREMRLGLSPAVESRLPAMEEAVLAELERLGIRPSARREAPFRVDPVRLLRGGGEGAGSERT
ncbi:MAG: hydrogenase maturation protease [Bacillota bacterium]|nr:hydrogenase maturation protease [Bacillota bacterium]